MIPSKSRHSRLIPLIAGSACTLALAPGAQAAESRGSAFVLPELVLESQQTANLRPATTYETLVSNLDFEPQLDLQTRNMAEAQGDVSIRGGIFENTGFRVGAATLFDPQTGHYFAEIPLAPEMLAGPKVYTGSDNALYGFNSSVGTLQYDWSPIVPGGSLTAGAGEHDLNFQRLHQATRLPLGESGAWQLGAEIEYSRSEGDGTIEFGDHDFERFSGRVQLLGPNSQTDFVAGYQDKFFGWPGMYTGNFFFAFPPETEQLKTRLFLINHRQEYGIESDIELTAYYRRHSDHYRFNRFSSAPGNIHETDVVSIGWDGKHFLTKRLALHHAGQITADEIESNTLENGPFTSRSYWKFSLVPEYALDLSDSRRLRIKAGAGFDDTNRDGSEFSPLAELSLERTKGRLKHRLHLGYSESTQVPGYTAIGGNETNPIFRSNNDLGRETSRNLEIGSRWTAPDWSLQTTLFHRWDDDLVDWTFVDGSAPRTANAVDLETLGFEIIGSRYWGDWEAIASYTYLHKDEDFDDPDVIGSFYALNFPEHRATLGVIWRPLATVELRIDNEYRSQEENPIREGPDDAFFTHFTASYFPPQIDGLEIFAAVDKPWDEDFQEIPDTPGRGDLVSGGVTYRW